MHRALFGIGIVAISLVLSYDRVQAQQVTPDGTANTQVNRLGNQFTITNGSAAGSNLFHSFQEFSIPTNGSAVFDLVNTPSVSTIFSRVTGSNLSSIDGTIRTINSSNPISLFLLNPNGILFGANARLEVGGSFIGSTASSVRFADGSEFSTTNATAPLLTISVPIGLQFGQNPGAIQVQGMGHRLSLMNVIDPYTRIEADGLKVQPGNTFGLIGGDLNLVGGVVNAPGGNIEFGSVGAGTVGLQATARGWQFNYGGASEFRDIRLSQAAIADASGSLGTINTQSRQLSLRDGSALFVKKRDTQPGSSIQIRATDLVELTGASPSRFTSTISLEGIGTPGQASISVDTKRLQMSAGGTIDTRNTSTNVSGSIRVNASESITISDGTRTRSSVVTAVTLGAGRAGDVEISTSQLRLLNGGNISSGTFGQGNAGNVTVNADAIEIAGVLPFIASSSVLGASTFSSGNAGNITVNTRTLSIRQNGGVVTSSFGSGSSGQLTVNASESISISDPETASNFGSRIDSAALVPTPFLRQLFRIREPLTGNAGSVTVNTPTLNVTNGARISVTNQGTGNAGTVSVNANQIRLDQNGEFSAATRSGEGGNISVTANVLLLRSNSDISTEARGRGNGGNITLNIPFLIGLDNSDIIANAFEGRGGNIQINTRGVFGLAFRDQLTTGNDITASSNLGVSGTVQINNIGIDPNSGLIELSETLGDEDQQVAAGCSTTQGSSFVVTGRGGIPEDPRRNTYDRTWSDLRDLSTFQTSATPVAAESRLQEATAWQRNSETGEIELIAIAGSSQPQPATCAIAAP